MPDFRASISRLPRASALPQKWIGTPRLKLFASGGRLMQCPPRPHTCGLAHSESRVHCTLPVVGVGVDRGADVGVARGAAVGVARGREVTVGVAPPPPP